MTQEQKIKALAEVLESVIKYVKLDNQVSCSQVKYLERQLSEIKK